MNLGELKKWEQELVLAFGKCLNWTGGFGGLKNKKMVKKQTKNLKKNE